MKGKTRVSSYLSHDPQCQTESFMTSKGGAKPDLQAMVSTDEAGGRVIRLSDGFPVRRSSYGRLRLEQRSMGEGTK